MKKYISLLFLALLFHLSMAQMTSDKYWIQFKDKNESPFSLKNPAAYLSQKAIERRNKQNILISTNDLPVNPGYINEIKAMGGKIINQSRWFNAITISTSDTNKINSIKALVYVKDVKKLEESKGKKVPSKFELESNTMAFPIEKSDRLQTTDVFNYGPSFFQANQIGVNCLHNLGYQGQGMTIAILDAGFLDANILPAFDSLRFNNQILGCRDFVTGDTMVYEDYPHGMNVLSCMGGNLPGQLIGTAPKAKYWLLRTEDAATETISEEINWLVGAEFADSVGADVINSSLGYNYFDNPADNILYSDLDGNTTIITKAADWAASKGIMVVSAAGNSGGAPWYKITAPGDADSILTVGAVDSAGYIVGFSSRGPTFDGRIKPNTVARGLQSVIAANGGGIVNGSGTSFASPITAGAVACLWQANPTATNMQILYAIEQSASQFSNPDTIKGYGIPNFCTANNLLTGINKPDFTNDELTLHPNPFKDNFDITFYSHKNQTVQIELYDISGRAIFKQQKRVTANSNNTFNFTEAKLASNGLYLLHFITPEKNYSKKLIKK